MQTYFYYPICSNFKKTVFIQLNCMDLIYFISHKKLDSQYNVILFLLVLKVYRVKKKRFIRSEFAFVPVERAISRLYQRNKNFSSFSETSAVICVTVRNFRQAIRLLVYTFIHYNQFEQHAINNDIFD